MRKEPLTLLQEIRATPDGDGPRRAYADWLDKHGDPARAEFIRLQLQLDSLFAPSPPWLSLAERQQVVPEEGPEGIAALQNYQHQDWGQRRLHHVRTYTMRRSIPWPLSDTRLSDLLRREEDLLAEHAERWLLEVSSRVREGRFRRGFVEGVTFAGDAFLQDGENALRTAPIRLLTLESLGSAGAEELARLPHLSQISGLRFRGEPIGAAGGRALARSAALGNLTCLDLERQDLDDEALADLARSNSLSNLNALFLKGNPIWEDGLIPLLKSKTIVKIFFLGLEECALGGKSIRALARAPSVSSLVGLSLARGELLNNDLQALANSPYLSNLRELDLGWNEEISVKGMEALANSRCLRGLKAVNLEGIPIGDAGAIRLASSANLANLEFLNLSNCALGDRGVLALAASAFLTRLTELTVNQNGIGIQGFQALATAESLPALTTLHFGGNRLHSFRKAPRERLPSGVPRLEVLTLWGDRGEGKDFLGEEGAVRLAEMPSLARLHTLNLGGNGIGDVGAAALGRSPHLSRLEHLNLERNQLGEAGLRAVLGRPGWTGLTTLVAARNEIGDQAFVHMEEMRGLAALESLHLAGNAMGGEGAKQLARAPLHRLRVLDLSRNAVSDDALKTLGVNPSLGELRQLHLALAEGSAGKEGIRGLTGSRVLQRLEQLELGGMHLGVEGARMLSAWSGLARVRKLVLDGCHLGEEGVGVLAQSPHLGNLLELHLRNDTLSDVGAQALASSPICARLLHLDLHGNRINRAGGEALFRSPQLRRLVFTRGWGTLDLTNNPLSGCANPQEILAAILAKQPQLEDQGEPDVLASESAFATWHSNFRQLLLLTRSSRVAATISAIGPILIWDTATGAILRRLPNPGYNGAVALAEDGLSFAGAWQGWLDLWALGNRHLRWSIRHDQVLIYGIAFAPNGRFLATAGHDGSICVRDPATGEVLHRLGGHSRRALAVAFSEGGAYLVSTGSDQRACVWELPSGTLVRTIDCNGEALSVAISLDGHRIVTSDELKVWHANGEREHLPRPQVLSVCLTGDGKTLLTCEPAGDYTLYTFEPELASTGIVEERALLVAGGIPFTTPQSLSLSEELTTPTPEHHEDIVREIPGNEKPPAVGKQRLSHDAPVRSVAFAPDGSFVVTAGDDCTVRVWDTHGRLLHVFPTPNRARVAAISSDGVWIAAATAWGEIYLWDRWSRMQFASTRGTHGEILAGCFLPDALVLGYRYNGDRWSLGTLTSLALVLSGENVRVWAFSPEGNLYAHTGNDPHITVRSYQGTDRVHTLQGHLNLISGLAFRSDGKMLASCSLLDETLRLWDTATGEEHRVIDVRANACAFSTDGRLVATGDDQGVVTLWDPRTGRALQAWDGATGEVYHLAFAPQNRAVAAACADGHAHLWGLEKDLERQLARAARQGPVSQQTRSTAFTRPIFSLQLSQPTLGSYHCFRGACLLGTNRLVTADTTGMVRVWDMASNQVLHSWEMKGDATGLAVSGDQSIICASIQLGRLYAWDPNTGDRLYCVKTRQGAIRTMHLSVDGKTLALGVSGQGVQFRDIHTGQLFGQAGNHRFDVHSIAFSPDGLHAASSSGDGVRLLDVHRVCETHILTTDTGAFQGPVLFTPDGQSLLMSNSQGAVLWDLPQGKITEVHPHLEHRCGLFTPDGRTLFVAADKTVQIWDFGARRQRCLLSGFTDRVSRLEYDAPTHRLVAVAGDRVAVYDLTDFLRETEGPRVMPAPLTLPRSNLPRLTLPHKESVCGVQIHPDGQTLLSAGNRKEVIRWDAQSGEEQKKYRVAGSLLSMVVAPDGSYVVTGNDAGELQAVQLAKAKRMWEAAAARSQVRALAISADGTLLAAGGNQGELTLWDAQSGQHLRTCPAPKMAIENVTFRHDGAMLASATQHGVWLWETATARELPGPFARKAIRCHALAFHPQQDLLALSFAAEEGERGVLLWQSATGEVVRHFTSNLAQSLAFSEEGTYLAAAHDQSVVVWEVATGRALQVLAGPQQNIGNVAIHAKRGLVVGGSADNTVCVWDL